MLHFRSEEHIERWCRQWNQPRGAVVPMEAAWALAREWHSDDRRDPHWQRRTPAEAQALFTRHGLTDPFWRLTP